MCGLIFLFLGHIRDVSVKYHKYTAVKKTRLYPILLILFVFGAGFIVFKYKKDKKNQAASFYLLQDRKGPSPETNEWKGVKAKASNYMKAIRTDPDDIKSRLGLASLYIQEARITGNYMYYDAAAMKYVNDVLQKDSLHFEALTLKALLYLSQHHFAEGLIIAQKAQGINPHYAFLYGLIVDANVEMGNYDSAVANSDKMVSIRPDIRSYSRISYLREIYGDYTGAIEAMKMAVEASPPGDESTEWCRVQLGQLYENTGELKFAEMHYIIALNERPNYAHALAGLARIALAAKDYNKAITYYLQADSLVINHTFKEELIEIYSLAGKKLNPILLQNL